MTPAPTSQGSTPPERRAPTGGWGSSRRGRRGRRRSQHLRGVGRLLRRRRDHTQGCGRRPRRGAGTCAQELGDLGHRPARRRIVGHRRRQERGQPAGVLEPRRFLVHDPVERAEHVVAHVVRRPAGQGVEEGGAERPDVAGSRGLLTRGDLGGEVGRRTGHHAGLRERRVRRRARDAEVGELHVAVGGDQDVRGLHVAVHHARGVRRAQRLGRLGQDRGGFVRRHRPLVADQVGEVAPLDVLHDQPLLVVVLDEVEDGHHVGVVDPRGDPGLPLGAHQVRAGAAGHDADPLDRHFPAEHLVAAEPHGARPATTDLPVERVPPSDHRASLCGGSAGTGWASSRPMRQAWRARSRSRKAFRVRRPHPSR